MADYRRLVGNAIATFSGRVATMLLALLLSTLLFRWLGPAKYGIWSFFFVLVSYSSMVDLGLSTTIERFVARARFENDRLAIEEGMNLCCTFAILLSAAVEAAVLLVPASVWERFTEGLELRRAVAVFPLCLLLTNLATISAAGLAGIQRMTRLNVLRAAANTGRSVLVLVLAAAGIRRLDVLLLAYAATGALAAWPCWTSLEREVGHLAVRPFFFRRDLAREYVRFGSAVQFATLSYQSGDQLLRLLIGSRFGPAFMGFYDLGTRVAFVVRSFASVLLAVMVPFGTEKHLGEGASGIARLHRLSLKYLALFVLPVSAIVFFEAPAIVAVWLKGAPGSDVVLAVFRIYLVGNAIAVLGGPAAMIGRSLARPQIEAFYTFTGVAAGLLLAAIVPGFHPSVLLYAAGSFGAALAIWARLGTLLDLETSARDLAWAAGCALVAIAVAAAAHSVLSAAFPAEGGLARFAAGRVFEGGAALAVVAAVVWMSPILGRDEKQFWIRNAVWKRAAAESPGPPA